MAGTPKNYPMNESEIIAMESKRASNKLHSKSKENVSDITGRIHSELEDLQKIPLTDGNIDEIKQQIFLYFKVCSQCGTVPTLNGMSRALGHTRESLRKYCAQNSHTEIADFIEICRNAIEDALDVAALQNSVNCISALFILKSVHSRIDKAELHLTTQPESILRPVPTLEQLEADMKQICLAFPEDE